MGEKPIKPAKSALFGLYINLFLIIFLLVCFIGEIIIYSNPHWSNWIIVVLIIISGIFNFIIAYKNIINSITLFKNNDHVSLRQYMKTLKLGLIPYSVINFILYSFIFFILFASSKGIIVVSPVPLFFLVPIFFTYLAVLFTSSYGIGYVLILNKGNKLKNGYLVIHILLQLCFVLDVISTIILLIRYKNSEALPETTVLEVENGTK